MKAGDTIKCKDAKDLLQMQKDLELAGFHAVVSYAGTYTLRITGVPKISYVVKATDGRSAQAAYCDTLEEAEAAAEWLGQGYEFVEILKGYPGEWETVSQSW